MTEKGMNPGTTCEHYEGVYDLMYECVSDNRLLKSIGRGQIKRTADKYYSTNGKKNRLSRRTRALEASKNSAPMRYLNALKTKVLARNKRSTQKKKKDMVARRVERAVRSLDGRFSLEASDIEHGEVKLGYDATKESDE